MRNAVLFGECGVGKSSVINLILGEEKAKTSNDVQGCTDDYTSYSVSLQTGQIRLWDTVGLDEGTAGKTPADMAKRNLKNFLQAAISLDGVDLLLYCIRGANNTKSVQLKQSHWENYKFVFEEVCKKRIPIAMVVTHLGSYNPNGDMDKWWEDNQKQISRFGFQFCARACVTVVPLESPHSDSTRLELSRAKLRELLTCNDLLAPRNVLLLGDREDRSDFIDMSAASRSPHHSDRVVPSVLSLVPIPVALDLHAHINLWNMYGLGESSDDVLMTEKNLKLLVQGIQQTGGIDLLLFCFRTGRIKTSHVRMYNLFHAAICRKKVPVVIVILGPEDVASTWWETNEQEIRRRGLHFDRHIYIHSDPSQYPDGPCLKDGDRDQLIHLMQKEHSLGSWSIPRNPFWTKLPNVRAVVGDISWPTTTVVVCDTTGMKVFADIRTSLQSLLHTREHLFQEIDPQTISQISSSSSGGTELYASDRRGRGISLLMFFVSAEEMGDETWRTLQNFYLHYKGDITPLIVVVQGVDEMRFAEDLWKSAPQQIRRRIGAYLTYHPGISSSPESQVVAKKIMAGVVHHCCLMDLGEKVRILQEILFIWRRYRSQHK